MKCKHCDREIRRIKGDLVDGTRSWNNVEYSRYCDSHPSGGIYASDAFHEMSKEDVVKIFLDKIR